jgi:hypothetical protein
MFLLQILLIDTKFRSSYFSSYSIILIGIVASCSSSYFVFTMSTLLYLKYFQTYALQLQLHLMFNGVQRCAKNLINHMIMSTEPKICVVLHLHENQSFLAIDL